MLHRPVLLRISLLLTLCAVLVSCAAEEETDSWSKIQKILAETKDIIVLDGAEKTALK